MLQLKHPNTCGEQLSKEPALGVAIVVIVVVFVITYVVIMIFIVAISGI